MVVILGTFLIARLSAQESEPLIPAATSEVLPPPTPVYLPDGSIATLDAMVNAYHNIPYVRRTFGVSGKNLTVAVVDTGINLYHLDFKDKIAHAQNFTGGDPQNAEDDNGHGSHVASIIAATQASSHIGAAPDARIVALKVFGNAPYTYDPIVGALQWLVDHHKEHDISVVNLSLGDKATNLKNDDGPMPNIWKTIKQHISTLRVNNIAVVVSAGNSYNWHHPKQGMAFPAICRDTISVGAMYGVDKHGNGREPVKGPFEDGSMAYHVVRGRCTPFTQRLGEQDGGKCRTDIFAAGFEVTGASKVVYNLDGVDKEASANGTAWASGTSQSAPVISGIILLMQEYYRKINNTNELPSVDLIEQALWDGGLPLHDVEDAVAQRMDNVISSGSIFRSVQAERSFEALSKPGATVTTPPHKLTPGEQGKLIAAQKLKSELASRVSDGLPAFPDFKPNVRFYISAEDQKPLAERISAAAQKRFTPLAIRNRLSPPEQTKIEVRYLRYPEDSAVAVAMASLIKEQLKETDVSVNFSPADVAAKYPIGLNDAPDNPGDIEVWFPRQKKSN